MAQFRATIEGTRGPASRLGTKDSGLLVTANGWNIGVRVDLDHINGEDIITICLTAGSGHRIHQRHLGRFKARGRQIVRVIKEK